MKNKLFIFSALIVSALVFSACTLVDQYQADKDSQVTPTINMETGDETETELLKQLNADKDTAFDSEFKSLDTEINQ